MGVEFEWPASPHYAEFVRAHGEALLRLAVLLTGNRHDAEDVLQDAVIAVARRWAGVRRAPLLRCGVVHDRTDIRRLGTGIRARGVPDR